MKRELWRRLEALEYAGKDDTPEIWVQPPERGLSGWECMAQNAAPSELVQRLPDESDDDLAARARQCMERMRREGGATSGARVFFGLDDQGMTR